MTNDAIQLDDSLFIGKGLHRLCYRHPSQPSRCIKTNIDNSPRSLKEIQRELRFYRFLEKSGGMAALDGVLPRYHGRVDTTRGEGHVFDLVLDADGSISRPLSHYLQNQALTAEYGERIQAAYQEFKTATLREGQLITMALKPYNLLLQIKDNDRYALVIVDSLGTADLIPAVYLSRLLAKAKMQRHLTRFEHSLKQRFGFTLAPTQTGDDTPTPGR